MKLSVLFFCIKSVILDPLSTKKTMFNVDNSWYSMINNIKRSDFKMSAKLIAKKLLIIARLNHINDISPPKLDKLLYLTYLNHVRKHNEPLFKDSFLVTKHGLVVKSVQERFNEYGSTVITEHLIDDIELSDKELSSITETLKEYGDITNWNLIRITHKEDGLWDRCFKNKSDNNEIHFKNIIQHLGKDSFYE